MAQGDVILFNQFVEDMGDKSHNLSGDTLKMGVIDNTTPPTAADADPRWGAGGSTNHSTNEVTPGGNYSSGGPTVADGTPDAWTRSGSTTTLDLEDVSIATDGSNPTDCYWGIIYNDTDTGKRCIGYVQLHDGASPEVPIDMTAGFTLAWHVSGLLTIS